MKCWLPFLLIVLFTSSTFAQADQYIRNGSASQDNCHCYTLTPATVNQSGSVWNKNKISLAQPFDFEFTVNLGCQDANGADGIVFILQPISTSIGSTGEGMGFGGVSPSIGIALDTWQNFNLNDPEYDHISLQANGNTNHSADLTSPVPISATSPNVEDCQWHTLRISWDPTTRVIRAYFDGSLRLEKEVDLIGTIFNNDPMVYWGFTGATGGATNQQRFCTALTPDFSFNLPADGSCTDRPLTLLDASVSFAPIASYHWDFGDGTTSSQSDPPPHSYARPGKYPVRLAITGLDGCTSDTLEKIITIGSVPSASFAIRDTCERSAPALSFTPSGTAIDYAWTMNGQAVSGTITNALNGLSAGTHNLVLMASSPYGCGPDAVQSSDLRILPAPKVSIEAADGCVDAPLTFTALQEDTSRIARWQWDVEPGKTASGRTTTHTYSQQGRYPLTLTATGANGCTALPVVRELIVNQALADAGRDTIVFSNSPFVLQGSGNGAFQWSPTTGLSSDRIDRPEGRLMEDQGYALTVTTSEGCVATDSVYIEVYKGSAIHVPTAFTPNGDGRNDRLLPKYTGIRRLAYFNVYNRWGQAVFTTTDLGKGWDGTVAGRPAPSETFVWMLQAEDLAGKTYQLKGSFVLLR